MFYAFKLCLLLIVYHNFQRDLEFEEADGKRSNQNEADHKDVISQRLQEIYKRLEVIDADSAEARAASILAVSD